MIAITVAMTIDDVTVIAIIAGIMTVFVSVYYHCAILIIITTGVTMWTP